MTAIELACALLRQVEGLRLEAYRDHDGGLAIGYRHRRGVSWGDHCTQREADLMLAGDVRVAAEMVRVGVPRDMAEHQRAALIAFAFAVGPGVREVDGYSRGRDGFLVDRHGEMSGVRSAAIAGQWQAVARELGRWIYVQGRPCDELIARREREIALLMGDDINMTSEGSNHA